MKNASDQTERAFLQKRLRQETEAALSANDARAAAAHVGLANQYLKQLNGVPESAANAATDGR